MSVTSDLHFSDSHEIVLPNSCYVSAICCLTTDDRIKYIGTFGFKRIEYA